MFDDITALQWGGIAIVVVICIIFILATCGEDGFDVDHNGLRNRSHDREKARKQKATAVYHVPFGASKRYTSRKTRCVIVSDESDGMVWCHVIYATTPEYAEIDTDKDLVKNREGKFCVERAKLERFEYKE